MPEIPIEPPLPPIQPPAPKPEIKLPTNVEPAISSNQMLTASAKAEGMPSATNDGTDVLLGHITIAETAIGDAMKTAKDTKIIKALQSSQDPEQTFSELSEKENLTWFERADLCKWHISHQQPNTYSLETIQTRENKLLPSIEQFTPEQIAHAFTENLPRSFEPVEVLDMMSSMPFEKLNLDVDNYRTLSAYAITQLQKVNPAIDPTVENPLPVQIARGLSKRGLLDWSRFLDEQDVQAVQQQLEQRYQKLLIGGMNGKAHGLSKPEGRYDRSYTPLNISQASQEVLEKYFDSSAIGIQSDQIASTANPGYLSELNGIVVGTPDLQRRFATSGFPMYQLAEAHQPAHDLRLNFNFTGDQSSIIDQAKTVSKLISNAQIRGVPITSKLTTADDQAKYAGRILLYTDYAQLETLLENIQKNNLTTLTPDIQTPTKWNVQMNLTADGNISVRGSGEGVENNTEILRSGFLRIKDKLETSKSRPDI